MTACSRDVAAGLMFVLLVGAASGCDSGAGDGAVEFEVRDSSGVRVAVNPSAHASEAPTHVLEEAVRIGAVSGSEEEEFGFLMDLAVGDSGEIYGLDSGKRAVRVFSPKGEFLREFGGPGEGPGEFDNELLRISVALDTVVVQDRLRFHLFDPQGEHIGTVGQQITGNMIPPVLDRGAGQWLLGQVELTPSISETQRTVRDTFRIRPLDLIEGRAGRPIIERPSKRRRYLSNMGQSRVQWMGPEVAAAVRANGEIYLVDGDEYTILVFSPEGELVRKTHAGVDRIRLGEEDLEQAISESTYGFGEEEVRDLGAPAFLPVVGRLLVSPNGQVLIHRRDLSESAGDEAERFGIWDLLDADGRIVGRITIDENVRPLVLTDSHLYTITRDELDVQYIVGYQIVPRVVSDSGN